MTTLITPKTLRSRRFKRKKEQTIEIVTDIICAELSQLIDVYYDDIKNQAIIPTSLFYKTIKNSLCCQEIPPSWDKEWRTEVQKTGWELTDVWRENVQCYCFAPLSNE